MRKREGFWNVGSSDLIRAVPKRLGPLLQERRPNITTRWLPVREDVPATPLGIGRQMLPLFGIEDDWLPRSGDTLPPYGSHVHVIAEAHLVSSAGIVVLPSREVIEDTIDHTQQRLEGYRFDDSGAFVFVPPATRLRGRFLSLLLGCHWNHFHFLIMNLARIGILADAEKAGLAGVLVPADLPAAAVEALRLSGAASLAPLLAVPRGQVVAVDELVLPWNVASGFGTNPDIVPFLRSWTRRSGTHATRRLYLDRRAARARPMVGEDALAGALATQGFEVLRLETMTMRAQIDAFADAAIVVAPHGAGLANMVFAPPRTAIVELMPADRRNWCYRHLAAASGYRYDAVFGRRVGGPASERWVVSPTHVQAAIERLCDAQASGER